MKGKLVFLSLLVSCLGKAYAGRAGDTVALTLSEVVAMARFRSIDSKQAITVKETKYWVWRTFLANYRPQLSLTGTLPGYSKTFNQVIQPNGTIQFQPVHNDNSSLNLPLAKR